MMSAHHLKQHGAGAPGTGGGAGGLNTVKNNDHKIKFSGVSIGISNAGGQQLDSQRSAKQFI